MANKENQEALNRAIQNCFPKQCREFCDEDCTWVRTLQQAINDLELYKKALDNGCLILARNVELKNKRGDVLFPIKRYWKEYLLKESEKQ